MNTELHSPKDGTIMKNDKGTYLYRESEGWIPLQEQSGEVSISLCDMNKQIIAKLPDLDEKTLREKVYFINDYFKKHDNKFYLLYGKEASYFTLFAVDSSSEDLAGSMVLECAQSLGKIKSITADSVSEAIEIWVTYGDSVTYLYLFPYDNGIVPVFI